MSGDALSPSAPPSAYTSRDQWYFFRNYLFTLNGMESIISVIQPLHTADDTHVYPPRRQPPLPIFPRPARKTFLLPDFRMSRDTRDFFALFYSTFRARYLSLYRSIHVHSSCILLLSRFSWTLSLKRHLGRSELHCVWTPFSGLPCVSITVSFFFFSFFFLFLSVRLLTVQLSVYRWHSEA